MEKDFQEYVEDLIEYITIRSLQPLSYEALRDQCEEALGGSMLWKIECELNPAAWRLIDQGRLQFTDAWEVYPADPDH